MQIDLNGWRLSHHPGTYSVRRLYSPHHVVFVLKEKRQEKGMGAFKLHSIGVEETT